MVAVRYHAGFKKQFVKLKNRGMKRKVEKQLQKIIENPLSGKPMRYGRKGTRELYVAPFRISYTYERERELIRIIALYHKDKQ